MILTTIHQLANATALLFHGGRSRDSWEEPRDESRRLGGREMKFRSRGGEVGRFSTSRSHSTRTCRLRTPSLHSAEHSRLRSAIHDPPTNSRTDNPLIFARKQSVFNFIPRIYGTGERWDPAVPSKSASQVWQASPRKERHSTGSKVKWIKSAGRGEEDRKWQGLLAGFPANTVLVGKWWKSNPCELHGPLFPGFPSEGNLRLSIFQPREFPSGFLSQQLLRYKPAGSVRTTRSPLKSIVKYDYQEASQLVRPRMNVQSIVVHWHHFQPLRRSAVTQNPVTDRAIGIWVTSECWILVWILASTWSSPVRGPLCTETTQRPGRRPSAIALSP